MISRKHATALAVLAATAAAFPAGAAAKAASSAQDLNYLRTSIEGDRFEVDGGKPAETKGTNASVKALGARLVKDHSKSLSDAVKLARQIGLKAPQSPSPPEQWELQFVGALSGSAFDKAYTSLEVADHKQDIEETSFEISHGSNPAVVAGAKKDLPMLKTHLKLSRAALAAVGG